MSDLGKQSVLINKKECDRCGIDKNLTDFHKDKARPDHHRGTCKTCIKAYQKELYKNPSPRKPAASESKKCAVCGVVKPKEFFGLRLNGRYFRANCKKCESKRSQEWNNRNKERVSEKNRRTGLRRYYGMTEGDFDEMLKTQNGVCAICGRLSEHKAKQNLCVDHDHTTGAVRGLLCSFCNSAIGYLSDNPERAMNVVKYIQYYADRPLEEVRFFATQRSPIRERQSA